jgi:hypothetical protein
MPPVLLGTVTTGSRPASVAVSGTTAYVVNNISNSLQVFNVANPRAPVLLGTVATGSTPVSVAVSGTTAYVVNYNSNSLQTFTVVTTTATASAALWQQVAVFPNPASGSVSVSLPARLSGTATPAVLTNMLGQKVRRATLPVTGEVRTLVLAGVAPGVYTLQLQTSEGNVNKVLVIN